MNDSNSAKPKRRWYQFSLRTLCLFAMVVSVGASFLGVKLKQERERHKAIAAIEKLGGTVYCKGGVAPRRFGQPVVSVDIVECDRLTDAGLEHLKGFTQLRTLLLWNTGVTDTGLEHLKELRQLLLLDLTNTGVTDAGVEKLKQVLPNCLIIH